MSLSIRCGKRVVRSMLNRKITKAVESAIKRYNVVEQMRDYIDDSLLMSVHAGILTNISYLINETGWSEGYPVNYELIDKIAKDMSMALKYPEYILHSTIDKFPDVSKYKKLALYLMDCTTISDIIYMKLERDGNGTVDIKEFLKTVDDEADQFLQVCLGMDDSGNKEDEELLEASEPVIMMSIFLIYLDKVADKYISHMGITKEEVSKEIFKRYKNHLLSIEE